MQLVQADSALKRRIDDRSAPGGCHRFENSQWDRRDTQIPAQNDVDGSNVSTPR